VPLSAPPGGHDAFAAGADGQAEISTGEEDDRLAAGASVEVGAAARHIQRDTLADIVEVEHVAVGDFQGSAGFDGEAAGGGAAQ
jgi:hypothetical protein